MKDVNGIDLMFVDAELPEILQGKKYRCEVACFNPAYIDTPLKYAQDAGLLRVSASKVNTAKQTLFESRQTFYVSDSPRLDKMLDVIVDLHSIPSVKVGLTQEFDWKDFYDIEIDNYEGQSTLINYHRTV